jgi:mRNA-degrading endonuclease toxin of MazEF toxin-antitoxin module
MPTKQTPIYCIAGQVWRIADDLVTFADNDPGTRSFHQSRPVIVIQRDNLGDNADCPSVLIAPLSSKTQQKRPWEDQITPQESPLKRISIVKLQLTQPIPRTIVQDSSKAKYLGEITEDALSRILSHLIQNLTGLSSG